MPKVFISYARDESHGQNLATETQNQLQAAGFEVFRDVTGLMPGDRWDTKLEFELESSDLVILVVSEKARKSEWVHNEISLAKEIGLPIIPVLAEETRMPLWLRHIQALDFTLKADWQVLFKAISSHLEFSVEDEIPTIREVVSNASVSRDEIPAIREIVESPDELLEPVTSKNGIPLAPPGPFRRGGDLTDSCDEKPMQSVIIRAREAFWNQSFDEAAELYAMLIEREPTVINHKGELGNVFWKQGYPSKAAELYADIAVPMIKEGNGERVSGMVGFIGLFYPDRAIDIRKLLSTG